MITKLGVQNFKCFQDKRSFDFSKINLLTGINGRGKSTLLQALLILSQSAWRNSDMKKLIINDSLVQLGNYDDIKNSETLRSDNILFELSFDSNSIKKIDLKYSENPEEPLQAQNASIDFDEIISVGAGTDVQESGLEFLIKSLKSVHYVSADRLGPAKYVEKTNLPEFLHVGPRGENTINILANSINLPNVSDSLYRGMDSKSLIQQTSEWLSYILEGAKIDIKGKEKESSVLYMLLNNRNNSYVYKQANVGFGYSYILPLIVTGLIAQKGEVIIIENPEAHLHPRAQSRISEFFSLVSSAGVQVFIESHSEHILNGLRISALSPNIDLTNNDLAIHYFNESFESERLQIEEKGKISNWPEGFFDQQEIDLADIFKYSR